MKLTRGSLLFAAGVFLATLLLGYFVEGGIPQEKTWVLIAVFTFVVVHGIWAAVKAYKENRRER